MDIIWDKSADCTQPLGSFVDERDGTKYRCVQIGNQIWMAENLKYQGDWASGFVGEGDVQCDDEEMEIAGFANGRIGLYSWATAMNMPSCMNKYALNVYDKAHMEGSCFAFNGSKDPSLIEDHIANYQGIAPCGWHIPSVFEFAMLENFFDSIDSPESVRLNQPLMESFENALCMWTVNEYSSTHACCSLMQKDAPGIVSILNHRKKTDYLAVRCVKNMK